MDELAKSPKLRLIVTLILTIIIGLFSSILATQLMPSGKLDTSLLPTSSGFWVLLCSSAAWIYVQVKFMNYDQSVLVFSDDEHCRAYIRKAKLEGLVAKIKNDPNSVELVDAKTFLENLEVKSK